MLAGFSKAVEADASVTGVRACYNVLLRDLQMQPYRDSFLDFSRKLWRPRTATFENEAPDFCPKTCAARG